MSEREEEEGQEREEGEEREFFIREHLDPSGFPRADLWQQGLEDLSSLEVAGGLQWISIGPAPITAEPAAQIFQGLTPAGEVTDIAIDPSGSADRVIYVATNDGGIWKTENADDPGRNPTWTARTDFMRSLSMGAVALDPSNPEIVYAGTGNLFDGGHVFTKGIGIYKSIDGGETWAHVDGGGFATTFFNKGINRIVLPASDILLVATNQGLFRSVDGGMNFGSNAPGFNDGRPILTGNISSLRLDTAAPTTVYAAVSGRGIFRSTDSGATFQQSAMFVPPAPFNDIAFTQSTLPDARTMYASVQQGGPGLSSFKDLFKSTDAGSTWAVTGASARTAAADAASGGRDQSNYDLTIGIDPQNPSIVYIGFQQLYRSGDSGVTFNVPACTAGQVHFDHHALLFSPSTHWGTPPAPPATPRTSIYVGTDGGIARSDDSGVIWRDQNAAIATNLFRGIDIGLGAKNGYTYGGMQDTGTAGHRPADAPDPADARLEEWHAGINGDGGSVAVDPVNPKIVYGFDNRFFMKTVNRGQRWTLSATTTFQVTGASNASPIVITAANHNFGTGHRVVISGVNGNTAANGTWTVTSIDKNTFSLDGSTGNAAYTSGGTARGPITPIVLATNASPIVITTSPGHFLQTGDIVEISGVGGNTAANGFWTVTRLAPNTFSLDGSTGNAAYTSGGFMIGPLMGRNLRNGTDDGTRCIALAPNGASPATVVYVSEGRDLCKSTDAGITFGVTPLKNFATSVTAIACPDANTVWIGLADGTVHLSSDGGAHWDVAPFVTRPGGSRSVEGISVDPTTPARVAVVYSGMSEINPIFRTRHCFLTTDTGQHWNDIGGSDGTGPVGNLPDLPLHSVVWDTSTNPPTLIVASDAGVLRSTNLGDSWQVLGVNLPVVSCQSLAIDNTVTPRVLRIGTYGRSCFELLQATGPRLIVKSNLGFGAVLNGSAAELPLTLFNVGDATLNITSLSHAAGSNDFQLVSPPALPLTLDPGFKATLRVRFSPTVSGNLRATFLVQSNDALIPSEVIRASGIGFITAGTPRLGVNANLNFGTVQGGTNRNLPFQLLNTGLADLHITNISRTDDSSSDFKLVSPPSFPVTVQPGSALNLTARFEPSSNDELKAHFQIQSDDPRGPRTVDAKGRGQSVSGNTLLIILAVVGIAALVGLGVAELIEQRRH